MSDRALLQIIASGGRCGAPTVHRGTRPVPGIIEIAAAGRGGAPRAWDTAPKPGSCAIRCTLAFAIPLVWPTIPPLTDVPSHLARYHIAVDGVLRSAAFDYRQAADRESRRRPGGRPVRAAARGRAGGEARHPADPGADRSTGMLAAARAAHGRQSPPTALLALPLSARLAVSAGLRQLLPGDGARVLAARRVDRAERERPRLRAGLAVPASWVIWVSHSFALGTGGADGVRGRGGAQAAARRIVATRGGRGGAPCARARHPGAGDARDGRDRRGKLDRVQLGGQARLRSRRRCAITGWRSISPRCWLLAGVLIFAAMHRGLRFEASAGDSGGAGDRGVPRTRPACSSGRRSPTRGSRQYALALAHARHRGRRADPSPRARAPAIGGRERSSSVRLTNGDRQPVARLRGVRARTGGAARHSPRRVGLCTGAPRLRGGLGRPAAATICPRPRS